MTDTEIILLVLAGVYTFECFCWTPARAVCFSAGFGKPRPTMSIAPMAGNTGRLTLTSLLPTTTSFVCDEWPVALDADGLAVGEGLRPEAGRVGEPVPRAGEPERREGHPESGAGEPDWLAFDAIESIAATERYLTVNNRRIARLSSQTAARLCASRLQAVRSAPPGEREQRVAELLDALADQDRIAAKIDDYHRATRSMRAFAVLLWLTTFIAAPLVYWQTHSLFVGDGVIVFALFFALWMTIVGRYFFVRRRLVEESRWASLGSTLLTAVSPGSAIRVAETIGRERLAPHDPVAVAAVLCDPSDAAAFAAQRMRESRFPRPEELFPPESAAGRAQAWFRDELFKRRSRMLEKRGIKIGDFFASPSPTSDAKAYCPRCLGQFIFAAGPCPECGVMVHAFEPAAAGAQRAGGSSSSVTSSP